MLSSSIRLEVFHFSSICSYLTNTADWLLLNVTRLQVEGLIIACDFWDTFSETATTFLLCLVKEILMGLNTDNDE